MTGMVGCVNYGALRVKSRRGLARGLYCRKVDLATVWREGAEARSEAAGGCGSLLWPGPEARGWAEGCPSNWHRDARKRRGSGEGTGPTGQAEPIDSDVITDSGLSSGK